VYSKDLVPQKDDLSFQRYTRRPRKPKKKAKEHATTKDEEAEEEEEKDVGEDEVESIRRISSELVKGDQKRPVAPCNSTRIRSSAYSSDGGIT
jgi:uncharacterized membrane protein YdbT with pleckstrin-like domain